MCWQMRQLQEKYTNCQKSKPDQERLPEVFFKSAEKGFGSTVIVAFYCAQHTVIKSCQRRANGNNGDAAKDKEQICDYNVTDLI